jgi:tryptophan synthase beta chain
MLRKMFEADFCESPSTRTEIGRSLLCENPNHPGSRQITQAEVAYEATHSKDGVAVISSFLNHVLMTETIIGLEIKKQLQVVEEEPDVLVGCVGGGSHFFGLIAPFVKDCAKKKSVNIKLLAAESETSSKLKNGTYDYVSLSEGVINGILAKAYRLHWDAPPLPIKGVGIQTQATAPLLSLLQHMGLIDARVYSRDEKAIFEAARIFLETEGRLLSPESAYAVRAVIDEALEVKKTRKKEVIVVSVSGTAFLDFGEKTGYRNLISSPEAL